MSDRPSQVFISYSHYDASYLQRLLAALKPLERDREIHLWVDTKLQPGQEWYVQIEQALATAQVAILLVSVSFLASDFVAEVELPHLLVAQRRRGLVILPVIVDPCSYPHTRLGRLQAVNDPSRALSEMTPAEQDRIWERVVASVRAVTPARPEPPPAQVAQHASDWDPQPIRLVTNGEYLTFVDSTGRCRPHHWRPRPDRPPFLDHQTDDPVTWVSWNDAVDYCDWNAGCLPGGGETQVNCTDVGIAGPHDAATLEWRDAGTSRQKHIVEPYTSHLITIRDRDQTMPNVGFRCNPVPPPSLPHFVPVPGGSCQLGADLRTFNQLSDAHNLPRHLRLPILRRPANTYNIHTFRMSAACVTNEDYYQFARAGGRFPRHWDAKWLDRFDRPFPARLANHPVVNVTAQDAEAYCAWSQNVRLPRWLEWERAAAGLTRNPYPWGAAYASNRCNGAESGSGSLVAVDAFPLGDSFDGVRQQCGNVWEWVLGAEGRFELRGGSYLESCELWGLTYAFRQPELDLCAPNVGFRVVAYD